MLYPTFRAVDARPEVVANAGAALQIIGSMVVAPWETLVDLLVELGAINSLPTCLAVTVAGHTRAVIGARRVRTLNCNTKAYFIMHKPPRAPTGLYTSRIKTKFLVRRARSLAINLDFIRRAENYCSRRHMFFFRSCTPLENICQECFFLSPHRDEEIRKNKGNEEFCMSLKVLSI
jgi:hypothetical protein